jgi:hypothetical protein
MTLVKRSRRRNPADLGVAPKAHKVTPPKKKALEAGASSA